MKNVVFETGLDFAIKMDQADPLKEFREQFYMADHDTIYLDGNSLGRLPHITREILQHVTDHQWGNRLIRSWNEGWYECASETSAKISQIIGAKKNEVMVCDSTSINLYKLAAAAAKLQSGRTKIVSDELNFPTDLYVLQGIVTQLGTGYELKLAQSKDGQCVDLQTLEHIIDENTALVVLSHVAFKSAFMYDMEAVTKLAHQKGALILWDLSHAAGAVPVESNKSNVDLAIGCTYKYLNGGPGAPAYLYVKEELQENLTPPIWGWFGDRNPFSFDLQFRPAKGIRKFLVGTPPILSLQAINPGLDIILTAGMDKIREKSVLQTDYLIFLYDNMFKSLGFSLGTPRDPVFRGSHVSLKHPEGYRICKALITPGDNNYKVIPDFREPDNIRLGIAPLYTSFTDIYKAAEKIKEIFAHKIYLRFSTKRESVT